MGEPLEYADPTTPSTCPWALGFAWTTVSIAAALIAVLKLITATNLIRLMLREHVHGPLRISFFGNLRTNGYEINWGPIAWVAPLGGSVSGVVAYSLGWRRCGRSTAAVAMLCLLAMIAMELIW